MQLSDVGLDLSQLPIIRAIASYDGHLVGASRTGSGKTTVMLAAIAGICQATNGGADFFCGSGKASVWMGLEQQTAKDGMPRVINVSLSKPESIEPLLQRLRKAVAIQEVRENVRIQKTIKGEKVNPRPLYFVLDEWLIILKVAKKCSKQAYVELIDLVECLIFKGRQDKCYIWLFAQGHQCGSLHLDKDCRRNLGVIALGGGGNFESVAAAIGDSDLVENVGDRGRLQSEYQSLIADGIERIYYSSIGGHKVSKMDVLPDMETITLFPPDEQPLLSTPPSVTTRVLDTQTVAASSSPPTLQTNEGKPFRKSQLRTGVSPDAASPERHVEPKPVGNDNPEVKRLEQLLENGTNPTEKKSEEFELQKIKIEQDRLKLEREKHQLEIAKTRAAIVDLHLSAEAKWNLITLGFGILVFIIYAVPPFSGALQGLWHFTRSVGDGVGRVVKKVDKTVDYWAPNLGRSPALGDKIAGYTVTSPYGPRDTPTEGASSFHHGADEAMPIGTPLHAIGNPGEKVSVRCFQDRGGGLVAEYHSMGWIFQNMHLSRCAGGEHLAGSIIASSGNSGISTGPHLHFGQKKISGEPVAPQTGYIWWAITGDQPQPVTSKLEGSENDSINKNRSK